MKENLILLGILALMFLPMVILAWKDWQRRKELPRREQLRREYPPERRPRLRYEVREQVLERDRHRCKQCDSTDGIEVHHIKQRSEGGADEPLNLITLCRHCHDSKHPGVRKYYINKWRKWRERHRI